MPVTGDPGDTIAARIICAFPGLTDEARSGRLRQEHASGHAEEAGPTRRKFAENF